MLHPQFCRTSGGVLPLAAKVRTETDDPWEELMNPTTMGRSCAVKNPTKKACASQFWWDSSDARLVGNTGTSASIDVHSLVRFEVVEPVTSDPYLKARIRPVEVRVRMTKTLKALMVSVRQTANRVISLSHNVPDEASVLLENIDDPSPLADFLAANLGLSIAEKQELLEEFDAGKRLEKISFALAKQLEVLELSHKIQGRVRESIDKNQREYFLQEQLKVIQSELGQEDRRTEELKELRESIKKAKMPEKGGWVGLMWYNAALVLFDFAWCRHGY